MSKAILSVVRYGPDYDNHMIRWYKLRKLDTKDYVPVNGKYIGSGGVDATDDLQKAQVFGFSENAQRKLEMNYTRHNKDGEVLFEVIPIELKISEPDNA